MYHQHIIFILFIRTTMKLINIIAIMPFLASSFMMQAPVYQDVNQPIEDRVVDVWKTNSK